MVTWRKKTTPQYENVPLFETNKDAETTTLCKLEALSSIGDMT